jgi:hypothetical protein
MSANVKVFVEEKGSVTPLVMTNSFRFPYE